MGYSTFFNLGYAVDFGDSESAEEDSPFAILSNIESEGLPHYLPENWSLDYYGDSRSDSQGLLVVYNPTLVSGEYWETITILTSTILPDAEYYKIKEWGKVILKQDLSPQLKIWARTI